MMAVVVVVVVVTVDGLSEQTASSPVAAVKTRTPQLLRARIWLGFKKWTYTIPHVLNNIYTIVVINNPFLHFFHSTPLLLFGLLSFFRRLFFLAFLHFLLAHWCCHLLLSNHLSLPLLRTLLSFLFLLLLS